MRADVLSLVGVGALSHWAAGCSGLFLMPEAAVCRGLRSPLHTASVMVHYEAVWQLQVVRREEICTGEDLVCRAVGY